MSTSNSKSGEGFTPLVDQSLDEQMKDLRKTVADRAYSLAAARHDTGEEVDSSSPIQVSTRDLVQALDETLGKQRTQSVTPGFFVLFPPFTVVCFVMCLLFGGFGLFKSQGAQGFLDIAKIFAGAMVGSSGASVGSRLTTRKRT